MEDGKIIALVTIPTALIVAGLLGIHSYIESHRPVPTLTVDTAPAPTATPATTPAAKWRPQGESWRYEFDTDDLSGEQVAYAFVVSTNQLSLDFPYEGLQSAKITLRKHPRRGHDVMLSIERGQIISDEISVRFDDGPVRKYTINKSDVGRQLAFIIPYSSFVARLKKADYMCLEFAVHNEGNQHAEFVVGGIDWE